MPLSGGIGKLRVAVNGVDTRRNPEAPASGHECDRSAARVGCEGAPDRDGELPETAGIIFGVNLDFFGHFLFKQARIVAECCFFLVGEKGG